MPAPDSSDPERFEQLRTFFNTSPDGIILHDIEGDIYDVNEEATESLGYSHEQLLSMDVSSVEVGHTKGELVALWKGLDYGDQETVEGCHQRSDGSTFPVEVSVRKIDLDGDQRFLTHCRDITERKERKRELTRYTNLVETIPAGVFRTTPGADGEFVEANPALVDLLGAESVAELQTHSVSDVYANRADRQQFSETLREQGLLKDAEYKFRTLTGNEFWASLTAVTTEVGEKTYFDGILLDITERIEYEQRLKEQRDDLDVLNQMLRHDIRNDLQMVMAYTELLRDECEDTNTELKEHIETVLANTNHAVDLTTAARDLANTMLSAEEELQQISLQTVLTSELEEVRDAYPKAVVTSEKDVPPITVQANDMLGSVFRNLLKNAIQHNDEEVPEVTVAVNEREETVVVRIADNGPGVPDDQKDAIFGKGEKGLDSPGTGLGLYLVQTLVERYGGDVWVEDNDPEGSVFVVELPLGE